MGRTAWVTGAAVTAAVLLGGCGGTGEERDRSATRAKPKAGDPGTRSGPLDGSWLTGSGKEHYLLSILEGAEVSLVGATYCSGTLRGGEPHTVTLDCPAGSRDRTSGTLRLLDNGSSLAVVWDRVGKEVYRRVDDPSDLPDGFSPVLQSPGPPTAAPSAPPS